MCLLSIYSAMFEYYGYAFLLPVPLLLNMLLKLIARSFIWCPDKSQLGPTSTFMQHTAKNFDSLKFKIYNKIQQRKEKRNQIKSKHEKQHKR